MWQHLPIALLFLGLSSPCSVSARGIPGPEPSKPKLSIKLIGALDLDKPEPYMASLRTPTGIHDCGGTLIHPRVVLTAAHCIKNGLKPDVDIGRFTRVGDDDFGFESYKTLDVITHEDYDPLSFDYDIALLVLSSASSRRTLELAPSDSCFHETGYCPVRLLGWGTTSEGGVFADILQEAFTRSVSHEICEGLLQPNLVTNRMICAGELKDGKYDSCQGDSGGPMILDGQQVGIVSFGNGCGRAQSPGVYTSIPQLRSWIDSNLFALGFVLPRNTSSPQPQSPPISAGNPCDCAEDGVSNGVRTFRLGCKQHLLKEGDPGFFCMTVGGDDCASASPSTAFPGAAWVSCNKVEG